MGRRGRNRDQRNKVLALIEEDDPELYAELVELRGRNPQAYRKRIRKLGERYIIDKPHKLMSNRGAMWHASMETDLDVLDRHFQVIRAALKRGTFDDRLDALRTAEREGQNRPLIFHLLDNREKKLEDLARERPQIPPQGGNWARATPDDGE
jgi:hypothetical protein